MRQTDFVTMIDIIFEHFRIPGSAVRPFSAMALQRLAVEDKPDVPRGHALFLGEIPQTQPTVVQARLRCIIGFFKALIVASFILMPTAVRHFDLAVGGFVEQITNEP